MTRPVNGRAALFALLLLVGAANVGRADELGRLFFSAEQRSALDRMRAAGVATAATGQPATQLAIGGEVRRRAGKGTIWINDQAYDAADGKLVVQAMAAPGQVALAGEGLPRVELKIGTTLDLETMQAIDPMAGSLIVVHRRPVARGGD